MFNISTDFFSLLRPILQLTYSSIDSLVGYLQWGFPQVLSVSPGTLYEITQSNTRPFPSQFVTPTFSCSHELINLSGS
jgi:hypothetical protein